MKNRQARGRGGVGPGRAGRGAATGARRPRVTVFEKADRIGGLLRYGIPDFKMEKHLIDRRLEQMRGRRRRVRDRTPTSAAMSAWRICARSSTPSCWPAAPNIRAISTCPAASCKGIHFAMEFLPQQNRRCDGDTVPESEGHPGHRQARGHHRRRRHRRRLPGHVASPGARFRCTQFELLPKPPDERSPSTPWPLWPMQLRIESSHEEGGLRDWGVATTDFTGDERGNVKQAARRARRPAAQVRADRRQRIHHRCRPGAAGHGLHSAR